MKFKKCAVVVLGLLMLCLSACTKADNTSSIASDIVEVETQNYSKNPLTGEENLDEEFYNTRPVSIMVNNISLAQGIQCGIEKADIVYETEVEQGVTRLLAVYQDVSKVEQIGSIRSARYPYIDLAMGHNAIYCHHGQDPTYAAPHLADTDNYSIGTNGVGKRIPNGKATEHTLYTFGDKLWSALVNRGKTENNRVVMWQDFAPEGEKIAFTNAANKVSVRFSKQSLSEFSFDATSGKYLRSANGVALKDYKTGNQAYFKNVFVLMTSINDYPDGYHRRVDLSAGNGYYITNGTYTPIKWSKGRANAPLVFTNEDGTPLKVSAGNSYVCLASSSYSQPAFE